MVLVAVALAVTASPRSRTASSGRVAADAGGSRSVRDALPSPPPSLALPSSPGQGRSPAPPARSAVVTPGAVTLPTEDPAGRVRVPVADRLPPNLPAGGAPAGWEVQEFTGDASVELVRNEGRLALRLRSDRTSFALHRDVVLDVRHHPILTWSWKVVRLPAAGDVRDPARDDQAAQVYVVFPRWPSPRTTSDVIGYVWDSRAPAGTTLVHPRAPNVRIVVLQSGPSRRGTWVSERRDVAADFRALFGRQPTRLGKVAVMTDSNDTRGDAEALFGELMFSRPGASGHSEIPTTMLR